MKQQLARRVDRLDDRLGAVTLGRRRERPALLAFVFHGILEDEAEIAAERVWPAQPLQVAELASFVDYFQSHGYRFVRPADVLAGLDPTGYYALLTFDDGYANNRRALPILRQRDAPATFFVSARHVAEGCAFWWDVLYRERKRRGVAFGDIRREVQALKRRTPEAIDAFLKRSFGGDALAPQGDTDRPFTVDELRSFARDPLVTVGNHTVAHGNLTRQSDGRVAAEIRDCQAFLAQVTGSAPEVLAYPDGRWNERSVEEARAAGLRLALTVSPGKTQLPLTPRAAMTIPRIFIPCGADLLPACARSRSDVGIRRLLATSLSR